MERPEMCHCLLRRDEEWLYPFNLLLYVHFVMFYDALALMNKYVNPSCVHKLLGAWVSVIG